MRVRTASADLLAPNAKAFANCSSGLRFGNPEKSNVSMNHATLKELRRYSPSETARTPSELPSDIATTDPGFHNKPWALIS
jgi:hypothetical protein